MIKIFIAGWRGVSNDKIADIVKTDHQLDKANVSDNIVAGASNLMMKLQPAPAHRRLESQTCHFG